MAMPKTPLQSGTFHFTVNEKRIIEILHELKLDPDEYFVEMKTTKLNIRRENEKTSNDQNNRCTQSN